MIYAPGMSTERIADLAVWPAGQPVERWIEPSVYTAKFADWRDFHDRLRVTVLRLAETPAGNAIDDGSIGCFR